MKIRFSGAASCAVVGIRAGISVCLSAALLVVGQGAVRAQAVPTTLSRGADGSWQLLRDGKPYYIKGAGGHDYLDQLKADGANSIRTWGVEANQKDLNEAQAHGLTVTLGIWLGHRDNGFRYTNSDQVARQLASVEKDVLANKDHPALLLWGLGNEAEGGDEDIPYYTALEAIAKRVKQLDPNHPTMTVVAEIGNAGIKARQVAKLCPDIDILGINSYGGLASLPQRLKAAGWTKPYVVTEFGPSGQWETGKTAWGAPIEPTSTVKAKEYTDRYSAGIASQKGWCLGSYVFLWGNKAEATATWYGLFLPNGEKVGAVDAMTSLWSGRAPTIRCPEIRSLAVAGSDQATPGSSVHVKLDAADPQGLPLTVKWILRPERKPGDPGTTLTGGDAHGIDVTMPDTLGPYRLFAYVDDGKGADAVGNIPLLVSSLAGKTAVVPAARLPLDLLAKSAATGTPPYIASGWMGNTAAIRVDEHSTTNPHSGTSCLRCEYASPTGWGGIVWQSPAGDWGDKPGGWKLTGAKRLVFYARGENGGEEASFSFGLIGPEKAYFDTAQGKLADVKLTKDWKQYSIPVADKDLSRVKTGFCWTVAAHGSPVAFYLDDIRFE